MSVIQPNAYNYFHLYHPYITYSACYSIYSNNTHYPFPAINPAMLGLENNLDLVQKVQFLYLPHKISNTKFPTQAIRILKRFSYKPIPKTEVPETRNDHSSTFRDPDQCSAHVFTDNFILLILDSTSFP